MRALPWTGAASAEGSDKEARPGGQDDGSRWPVKLLPSFEERGSFQPATAGATAGATAAPVREHKRRLFAEDPVLQGPAVALQVGSAQFQAGHTDVVSSVAFSPSDPALLASGSTDNTVRLWDLSSMSQAAVLQGHTASVTSVTFNR